MKDGSEMATPFLPAELRRKFFQITHLLWLALLMTALYIPALVAFAIQCPGSFVAGGMSLYSVYRMVEHLLLSTFLLTAFSLAWELLHRNT